MRLQEGQALPIHYERVGPWNFNPGMTCGVHNIVKRVDWLPPGGGIILPYIWGESLVIIHGRSFARCNLYCRVVKVSGDSLVRQVWRNSDFLGGKGPPSKC